MQQDFVAAEALVHKLRRTPEEIWDLLSTQMEEVCDPGRETASVPEEDDSEEDWGLLATQRRKSARMQLAALQTEIAIRDQKKELDCQNLVWQWRMQQEELAISLRMEDEALEQKFLEAKFEVEDWCLLSTQRRKSARMQLAALQIKIAMRDQFKELDCQHLEDEWRMQQEELATSHRMEDEALELKFLLAKLEVEMLDAIQSIEHVPSSCSEPASHGRIVTSCHVMPKETPAREESKPPDDHRGPEERPGKRKLAQSSPRSRDRSNAPGRRGQHSRRQKSRRRPWRRKVRDQQGIWRQPPVQRWSGRRQSARRDWKVVLSKIRKATSR